jgi:hypothetical protein
MQPLARPEDRRIVDTPRRVLDRVDASDSDTHETDRVDEESDERGNVNEALEDAEEGLQP